MNQTTFISGMTFNDFLRKTFLWMLMGLLIAAASAYLSIISGLVQVVFSNWYLPLAMAAGELFLVFKLSASLNRISTKTAKLMYIIYAAFTGVTFGLYTIFYGIDTMFLTFGYTAVLFGSMAFIGYTTKADLSRFSTLVMGSLITLIIVSVLNIFLRIDGLNLMISYAGVVLFTGITAYDVNKLKHLYIANQENDYALSQLAIYGALQLFLDFINLFIYILRIVSRNRD